VAFAKLVSRRPVTTRILAANIVVVLFFGLLATFTRAAWIGAGVGVIVVVVMRRGRLHVWPLAISASIVLVGFAALEGIAAARPSRSQGGIAQALVSRITSIADLRSGTESERIAIWSVTLPLIAS